MATLFLCGARAFIFIFPVKLGGSNPKPKTLSLDWDISNRFKLIAFNVYLLTADTLTLITQSMTH